MLKRTILVVAIFLQLVSYWFVGNYIFFKNYKFNKVCYEAYSTKEDQLKNINSFNNCLESAQRSQKRFDSYVGSLFRIEMIAPFASSILAFIVYLSMNRKKNKEGL